MAGYGREEGGLPSADELFGTGPELSPRDIAAEALRQMGEPAMPGYAEHCRQQYEGEPDVSGLAEELGLD